MLSEIHMWLYTYPCKQGERFVCLLFFLKINVIAKTRTRVGGLATGDMTGIWPE